jgi:hypothetical protein
MTKGERAYLSRVAALGCIVCRDQHDAATPAEIHHLREHTGAGRRESHANALPLCPVHHRQGDGSPWFGGELGYHVAPLQWEQRYGSQREMVERTQQEAGWKA